MPDMDTENSLDFFMNKVKGCIDHCIPVKSNIKKFNKPKWIDIYCVRKFKKTFHDWKRLTHSHSYRDYEVYCKLRNSASKTVKFAKKKHQKGIAESVKQFPQSFWNDVKA